MSNKHRRALFIVLSVAALMMFAVGASADDCDLCSPYTSHCNLACDRCTHQGIDGCDTWVSDTCGSSHNLEGICLSNGCNPSWSETSRVTQGTYDGRSFSACNHHSVQWVTLTDSNHCNESSDFWTQSYCDDVIDGSRNAPFYPSCCDGYDDFGPNSLFTCDGQHSCTG